MMKWLAIFFLLVNVGYFGWQMNQRLNQVVPGTVINEEVAQLSGKSLVLLSEVDELPPLLDGTVSTEIESETNYLETDLIEEGPDAKLPFDVEGSCVSIGPYESAQQQQKLKNWLVKQEVPYRKRIEEKRAKERYWVYLESQASEEEAKAQIEELKSKGLSDYYLISKGDMKNAISLGLFSTQQSVNRRLVELERKGYNPVVVPQHKVSKLLWLDVQIEDERIMPELPKGIEMTNLDCMEIALMDSDH